MSEIIIATLLFGGDTIELSRVLDAYMHYRTNQALYSKLYISPLYISIMQVSLYICLMELFTWLNGKEIQERTLRVRYGEA